MAESAYAAVLTEPRTIEVRKFEVPRVGVDDALLAVEATGICGSDWAPYVGTLPFAIPAIVLGHEVVGRVVAIGPVASERWNVYVDDRVVVEECIPCGFCELCRSGNYAMCDGLHGTAGKRYGLIDVDRAPHLWGGFGNYMYLEPNSVVHRIAESIPAEIAPLFIPISNGVRWVQHLGRAAAGDTVYVQGPGQHGLGCVVAAKEAGATCVIVAGTTRDAHRLEVAKRLGADHTILIDQDDVVDRVRAITGGRFCDVVIDATAGAPRAAQTAVDVAAINGRVLFAGFTEGQPAEGFVFDKVVMNGLTLIGAFSHEIRSVRSAIKILESQRYELGALCTHSFALGDVTPALQTLGGERGEGAIHITVRPDL